MSFKKVKHKFNAKQTQKDGIRFDSQIEAAYYKKLEILKKSGELVFFLRQVPLHLPGNTKLVIDFVEFWESGDVYFVDVKGVETEAFKIKKRQVEEIYNIEIKIIKKV